MCECKVRGRAVLDWKMFVVGLFLCVCFLRKDVRVSVRGKMIRFFKGIHITYSQTHLAQLAASIRNN